jgi:hypothetical protein
MILRYLSVIVLRVWSDMILIMSISDIRLIVSVATIDLIKSLSLWGNIDVLVYSPFKNIEFHNFFMSLF